jgi:hypothetical protein
MIVDIPIVVYIYIYRYISKGTAMIVDIPISSICNLGSLLYRNCPNKIDR